MAIQTFAPDDYVPELRDYNFPDPDTNHNKNADNYKKLDQTAACSLKPLTRGCPQTQYGINYLTPEGARERTPARVLFVPIGTLTTISAPGLETLCQVV